MFEEIRKVLDDIEWALSMKWCDRDDDAQKKMENIVMNMELDFAKALLNDNIFGEYGSEKVAKIIIAVRDIQDITVKVE